MCLYGCVYGHVRALACGCACTHLYICMWIWGEAIIKVLNLRISGLWSKQCLYEVCAPSTCWNSALQIGAHKNAKISRLTLCRYTLLYIRFLFISSLFHFSVFAQWTPPMTPPPASHTNTHKPLSALTTFEALNCLRLWIFSCQDGNNR